MISQTELKEAMYYNPQFGIFVWKLNRGSRAKAGNIAGCVNNSTGYIAICFNKKIYTAHRLAFLYMNGSFPELQSDHINGIRTDNRWSNLRAVSHQENGKNQKIPSTNTSGIAGVSWHKADKKWLARISIDKKQKQTYRGDDFFEAVCARKSAEIKYDYHPNHGR